MPNFSTKVNEWDGAYAPPRTVTASKSDAWGELASKLIPGAIEAAGRGYANATGTNVLGGATSAEEAQAAVEQFEKAVPFTDDATNTPDQKAKIDDMKAQALRKYGTNDKKIQALVSSGKISSLEANARRHQMLQEALSNPILAMFKEDFLEAATPFTGGNSELAKQYFGAYIPTDEEKANIAASEAVITQKAKFKAAVEEVVLTTGVTQEQATSIIQEQTKQAAKLAEAEATFNMRRFNSQESFVAGMQLVDNFMQQAGGHIAKIAASGQKLGDTDMQKLQGQLANSYQQNMIRLQKFGSTMTTEDYNKVRTELEGQYKNMVALINDSDGYKFYERAMSRTKMHTEAVIGKAYAELASKIPYVMAAYKIAPQFGDAWVGSMGGDLDAQMTLKTHPVWSQFLPELGYTDMTKETSDAYNNVAHNETSKWSFGAAIGFMKELVTPGKAAPTTAAVKQSPDAYRAAFSKAFTNDKMSLEEFANSDEWMVNSRTPDGAQATAIMLTEKMKRMRGLQLQTKEKIPENLKIRIPMPAGDVPPMVGGIKYEFNVPADALDPIVQKELVQAYKILSRSPAALKELNVESADEFIAKALTIK